MGRNDKRIYQRNCALSFKRNRTQWNKRKDKTMTLDTQVNPAEWQRFLLYSERRVSMGETCFTMNTVMMKTIRQTQCPLHIAVVSYLCFFPFSPIFYCFF